MSGTNLLRNLLRASLTRNTNKKLFASLLEQLLTRDRITDCQLGETLLAITDSRNAVGTLENSSGRRQLEYALEFAFSSGENLARFFKLLPQLDPTCQLKYIVHFKAQAVQISSRSLMVEFCEGIAHFTTWLHTHVSSETSHYLKRVWYNTVFLWATLVTLDPSLSTNARYKNLLLQMNKTASSLGDKHISAFIARKICTVTDSAALSQFQDQTIAKPEIGSSKPGKALSLNLSSKKGTNYVMLKKFIWLNTRFQQWDFNADMTQAFVNFFKLQDMSPSDLATEIISSFLNGMTIALKLGERPYVLFNWKNFIFTRLAHDLKNIVLSSSQMDHEWSQGILAAVESCTNPAISGKKVGGAREACDITREFLRSCLYQEIISLESFLHVYPSESENLSDLILKHEIEKLSLTELLTVEFSSRLENVDPEFTSLQESRLIEYLQNLFATNFRFLRIKQQKLAQLMEKLVGNLIKEKNNEKLRWISLVFLNAPSIANSIFFQHRNGPWLLLNKIINYIDNESFFLDEDDGNFQDTYACFGVILTGVISISSLFGVDFCTVTIKSSYTIDFINQFYFRLCDTLSKTYAGVSEQEKQIITNYGNLFTDWANALFDVNNDGLSDDLLKSMNVKQIYKFIFFLFREAFTAREMGLLSESSLNNGIDYLSQNFLAPCSLELMQWIASRIGPHQKNNDIMVEILLRIIEGNFGDTSSTDTSEQVFTSRMLLNTIGLSLQRKLRALNGKSSAESISRLMNILTKETNVEYCQCAPSQVRRDSRLVSNTLTQDIKSFLRESKKASLDTVSEFWLDIKHKWHCISAKEACFTIFEEVEHILEPRGPLAHEESKFVVDLFTFMVVGLSCRAAEDVEVLTKGLEDGKTFKAPAIEAETHFTLTMNDHYSSIFNENTGTSRLDSLVPEEKLQLREELMGDFEMGDLFDDMSEGLFDELMAPANEPTRGGLSVDVSDIYKQLLRRASPLWNVTRYMNSPEFQKANTIVPIVRARLVDELQKWKLEP